MIIKTCDHCGVKIHERRGFELRDVQLPDMNIWGQDAVDADFCSLPCLTGWSDTMRNQYGYGSRIPEKGSKAR